MEGNAVVVGAFQADCAENDGCGAAYAFRFNGTSWVEEQRLIPSDADSGDQFGYSVSVSGTVAIVGTGTDNSAYVFHFDGTSWVETQKLIASDGSPNDNFGYSVSVSGAWAMVGSAHNRCTDGIQCGATYATQVQTLADTPAASTWGLVSATMLLLAGGAFVIRRTANSPSSA